MFGYCRFQERKEDIEQTTASHTHTHLEYTYQERRVFVNIIALESPTFSNDDVSHLAVCFLCNCCRSLTLHMIIQTKDSRTEQNKMEKHQSVKCNFVMLCSTLAARRIQRSK